MYVIFEGFFFRYLGGVDDFLSKGILSGTIPLSSDEVVL